MAMSKHHKDILQTNRMKLVHNIHDIESVVSYLIVSRTITSIMEEEILAKAIRSDKVRELLTVLPRRGDAAFDQFYEALVKANENTAADILRPDLQQQREARQNPSNECHPEPPVNSSVRVPEDDTMPSEFPDPNDATGNVTVEPCQSAHQKQLFELSTSNPENKQVYKMNNRGLCLLFYNEFFEDIDSGLPNLNWDKESQILTGLFEKLDFEVVVRDGKTAAEMKNVLQEYDYSDYDCLVVFILTHGKDGQSIYGLDGAVLDIKDIETYFYSFKCTSLATKPKLFFIHAPVEEKRDVTSLGQQTEIIHDSNLTDGGSLDRTDASKEPANLPATANIYVNISTTAAKTSNDLSVYVEALVYVFKRYSHHSDLNSLMIKVNRLINLESKTGMLQSTGSKDKSHLSKQLYFFPGKFKDNPHPFSSNTANHNMQPSNPDDTGVKVIGK